MEGMSSDDEHDLLSSDDEEGEHNVENFMLAHPACRPLLQGFSHDEELCKVALSCHFSLDVIFFLSGLNGCLTLELSLWHSAASFLTMQRCRVDGSTRLWALVLSLTCGQCSSVLSPFPSRVGCSNMERAVMGGLHRNHNDATTEACSIR